MKRKNIFNALLIAGLLVATPLAVDAAGLGKLKVISALGQPLRAEIDLIAVPKDEVDLITARIATSEAYKQAKIEQQEGLSAVRFVVEKRANGDPYLKITSAQAFNEPFLDLLIQLDWPSGRLLREYTILLDPPGFQEAAPSAPAFVAPVVRAEPAVKPLPVPEKTAPVVTRHIDRAEKKISEKKPKDKKASPILKSQSSTSRQLTPAEQTFPRSDGSRLSNEQLEAAPASISRPLVSVTHSEQQEYKVKKGDSLSKIAREMKPEGYSLDQVMVALYERNKSAFDGNNMNRIKTGQILHAPDENDLAATKPSAATKEIKAHAANWNVYRQKLAGAVAEQSVPKDEAKPEASGKITAKAEDNGLKAQEPAKDVLKLSKGETSDKGKGAAGKGGGAEARAVQDKLIAAQDDAVAKDKALQEANSRISDLDKNVKKMQDLLDLKNKQLAELEKQAKAKSVVVPPTAIAKVEPPKPVVPPKQIEPPKTPEPAKVEPPKPVATPAPVAVVVPPLTPPAEKAAEPLVKAVPEQAKPEVKPEQKKPIPAAPRPKVKPAPEPETSFMDTVMSNPLYLGGVAAAIVGVLFAALWALGRRRKKGLASFEDSIMTGGGDLKTNTVFGNTAGGQIDTGDTSFLTDFSQAGMGAIDTNDVDPIAEAEVYMAYGRDAQAEEILKEAMSKDPNRHEIQLKLLEIYAGRKNTAAFETLAAELYAATSGQGLVWEKAAEFGRSIDAANPLYSVPDGGGAGIPIATTAAMGSVAAASLAHDLDFDFDLDLDSSANDAPAKPIAPTYAPLAEESPVKTLDFDIDTVMGSAPPEIKMPEPKLEEPKSMTALDFNLDNIIPQAVEKHADAPTPMLDLDADTLNFDLPEEPVAAPAAVAAKAAEEEAFALDFDFNLDAEPTSPPVVKPVVVEEPMMPELDLSGIDLNFDAAPAAAPTADFGGSSLEDATTLVGDSTVWEEASTKLDLARAYLEMGDKEGAREILQEVVSDGGPDQQADAKKLLDTLS
jgi:pilus assembly protein FimV